MKKELFVKLVIFKDYIEMRGQQDTKCIPLGFMSD